jgi:hypothetical protein
MNKTGAQMSPLSTPQMQEAARQPGGGEATPGDGEALAELRSAYIAEADPLGSVPPPGTLRGMVTTGLSKLTGNNPEVLIDKLGERLAFERSGVRLYEAFLTKCSDTSGAKTSIPLDQVAKIRDDEARHFRLLTEAMESLGADPTAQTPSADAAAVMSMGVIQVLTDPRTTIAQGLEALLTAELVDNAGWELLMKLAQQAGQNELARRFEAAWAEEEIHLAMVKRWLEHEVLGQAT